MSDDLWTWDGRYFGYRLDDELRHVSGRHAGRFAGDEVYGPDGTYLGEVMSENRLITRTNRLEKKIGSSFNAKSSRMSKMSRMDKMGKMGKMGYEEFQAPRS